MFAHNALEYSGIRYRFQLQLVTSLDIEDLNNISDLPNGVGPHLMLLMEYLALALAAVCPPKYTSCMGSADLSVS